MWTTTHVNDITDKDGCGQQHMLMTSLTRMDVVNKCQCHHSQGCMWTTHVNAITDKDGSGQQMSMPPLTRMYVDNTYQCHHSQGCMWTTHVNAITDKDGGGQQHMLMTSLTRMDVDNNTC